MQVLGNQAKKKKKKKKDCGMLHREEDSMLSHFRQE